MNNLNFHHLAVLRLTELLFKKILRYRITCPKSKPTAELSPFGAEAAELNSECGQIWKQLTSVLFYTRCK